MGAAPSLYAKSVQKGGKTRLRRAVMHHLVMHRILLHPGHPERGRELRWGEWCRNDRLRLPVYGTGLDAFLEPLKAAADHRPVPLPR